MRESTERPASSAPHVMRTPRSVDIEITARCNLRCRYCYFFSNPAIEYSDLSTEEWVQFLGELGTLRVMNVTFAGGEPFIRKDLASLLESIVRNRMRFSILSNGALITDEIAAFIAGTNRCDYVQISVDGSCPETHDAGRGKGSFEGALRGIRTLQRHQVPVGVRVTIHRQNVYDLEATARLLLEDLGLSSFSTNSAGYLGTCRLNADDMMLNTQERQLAMSTLLRLSENYGDRISAAAGPLADGRMWRRMEEARAARAASFDHGGRLSACGCPSNRIAVRADGMIVPCSMLAHLELGRINRDSLAELWQHAAALNDLRQRRTIALSEFAFCAGCGYVPYCTGNCPGLAFTMTGQVNHPSPDACLRRYLQDGGALA